MLNRLALLTLAAAVLIAPQAASAQQTFNVTIGAFVPKGEDARVEGDILNANRNFLVFDISEFTGPTIGGEWLIPFGNYLEGGIGASFSRRTVASVYDKFIDRDGTEIDQDLRLRLVPIDFTVRVLPLGQASGVQPYVGAGLGLVSWRYSESGEFVDFGAGNVIFRDSFVADGSATGPVVLGGIRFAGDRVSAGGEVRFRAAEGELPEGVFAAPKIDLGGWTYQATFGVRF